MRYIYGFDKSMPAEQVFRELKSVFQHHAPGKVASLKFDTYLNGNLRTVTIEIPAGEGPDDSRDERREMRGAHHDETLGEAKSDLGEDDSVNA